MSAHASSLTMLSTPPRSSTAEVRLRPPRTRWMRSALAASQAVHAVGDAAARCAASSRSGVLSGRPRRARRAAERALEAETPPGGHRAGAGPLEIWLPAAMNANSVSCSDVSTRRVRVESRRTKLPL